MHHFEKKNSKFFSLEGPCKNVWGPTRMFPRAPLWLSMGLHYLGKTEPTKYCFLLNAVLLQNLNNAQKHILLTFLTVWLTFHPTVSFLNYQQQKCVKYGRIVRTQAWRCFPHSLTAKSIMLSFRLIQTSPVAS